MSESNKGPNVDYRLQNLTNALYIDVNNDVVVRTGFTGNIIISGNVNIPGNISVYSTPELPVHTHITEVGTSDLLDVPYLPIGGNVNIDTMPAITGNVTVSGNVNIDALPAITGTVDATVSGNVNIDNMPAITGNVTVSGNVNIDALPSITGSVDANVSGNVGVTTFGNIDITGSTLPISGNINIDSLPEVEIKNDVNNPIPVSKDANVNSTTNRIYVSQETDVVLADSNYEMNIARGLVDGQYPFFRSALNPDCPQNVETSIWVEGGIYPFGSWTTAQRIYVVSDNAADVGQHILIEGLDSNYDYATAEIVMNGTTPVATTVSQTFIRIYTATVISPSNNSANAGEIRFHIGSASGTVVAHIRAGLGITKLSQYTVPRGYTGYILYGDATTFRSGSGNIGSQIRMMVRPFGMAFVCAFIAEVVNGYYRNDFVVPMKITEKSDIDVRVIADANNTIASCNYQLILIPNT